MKLCWDIETNGIDHTHVWCLAVTDVDTGKDYYFTDNDSNYPSIQEGLELLDQATVHIGHNLIGFDIPALTLHYGWDVKPGQKIVDTLLVSQLNDFYRPSLRKAASAAKNSTHAMYAWGLALGDQKHDDPSWLEYSDAMRERCISDVHINIKIFKYLMKETKEIKEMSPGYADAIRLEHEFSKECSYQRVNGWLFDDQKARQVLRQIEKRMAEIELDVEPHLEPRVIFLDKEPRKVAYLKDGRMDRVSREWFDELQPEGTEFQRTKTITTDLGNNEAVQKLLLANGWKPTQFNHRIEADGSRTRMSPKLTEDSYDSIEGELGKQVAEWRTLRSRRGQLEGFLKLQRGDNRLSCDTFTIGTNTFRCRHRGIVNVPGAYATLGREIRECFTSEAGRKIVAADSDSNQLRAFAHYLNNESVTEAIVNGSNSDGTDIHSRTANLLDIPRPIAKNVTYALLFGAGDGKLAKTAGLRPSDGPLIRRKLEEAFPGFQALTQRVQDEWQHNEYKTGRGFVFGLDGRRIYCDQHKAFNALLQAFEAITCKAAGVEAMRLIREKGLDGKMICHYHDEINTETSAQDAEAVGEILEYALGPFVTEKYNLNVNMGGTAEVGDNWFDVH